MINLLPLNAKKGVQKEYWLRVVTVWLLLLSLTLVVGALLLLPTYVLINSQVSVYQESADRVSAEVASYEDVSTSLVRANEQADFMLQEAKLVRFSELVRLFHSFESETVTISTVQLSRTDIVMNDVTIEGIASDRQALAMLRDELLANPRITAVELPISNLARGADIPFSMRVTLTTDGSDV